MKIPGKLLDEVVEALRRLKGGEILDELVKREARTGLRGLQEFAPVKYLDELATNMGGGSRGVELTVATPRQVKELGQAYADAPMYDESMLPAYDSMIEGTKRQFDMLTSPRRRGGLGVDVTVTPDDPYDLTKADDIRAMLDDLNARKLAVLSTETTGGHPLLTNEQNDMFRAVHDAFGHGATGRGVSRHGEEAAFLAHSRMYPREALPALAAELRAQNAYLNLFNEFGPQKIARMPDRFLSETPYGVLPSDVSEEAIRDAIIRMARWNTL